MKENIFTTKKKYQIIYADPPWAYRQQGGKLGRGTAKKHYPTMTTDEICALPIERISTENAMCFIWATFPNIDEALKVMQAWGFIYKTAAFVWVKKNKKSDSLFWGMGAYTRANAEICLIGIKNKTRVSEQIKAHNIHQIIESRIERHSKKPDETRVRIEALTGDVSRIELFARESVEGWDCWGNEV